MSLFDEFLKNAEYRALFDKLPKDQKPILMNSIRNFVEQVEQNLIKPLETAIDALEKSETSNVISGSQPPVEKQDD